MAWFIIIILSDNYRQAWSNYLKQKSPLKEGFFIGFIKVEVKSDLLLTHDSVDNIGQFSWVKRFHNPACCT